MNFIDTVEQSLMSGFFPAGWDMKKIDECCSNPPETILERQPFWNKNFCPVSCDDPASFNMMMGHEIAQIIQKTKKEKRELALFLPVGPRSMYKWLVYFLEQWNVDCKHVHTFNMDEWSDKDGNTLDQDDKGSFRYAMENTLYYPLKELTVPLTQRNYATQKNLSKYPEKIAKLKSSGAMLVTVFGIGRMMHVALWEPQFAAEFSSEEEWKSQCFRKGGKLHPLTIEQFAVNSYKSRTTLVPCFANTIGPGLYLQSDYIIGGCGGSSTGDMMWNSMSLWTTLRYGPSVWIPTTIMPTLEGKLFFLQDLAGPLEPVLE